MDRGAPAAAEGTMIGAEERQRVLQKYDDGNWRRDPTTNSWGRLGQSSEASIEIGIARSSVSVSASAQGSGIFRHLGRFSAFSRLFWGILDPTDSD